MEKRELGRSKKRNEKKEPLAFKSAGNPPYSQMSNFFCSFDSKCIRRLFSRKFSGDLFHLDPGGSFSNAESKFSLFQDGHEPGTGKSDCLIGTCLLNFLNHWTRLKVFQEFGKSFALCFLLITSPLVISFLSFFGRFGCSSSISRQIGSRWSNWPLSPFGIVGQNDNWELWLESCRSSWTVPQT